MPRRQPPRPEPKRLTVADLVAWLQQCDQTLRVYLEVGGDGAIHTGSVIGLFDDVRNEQPIVLISSENESEARSG